MRDSNRIVRISEKRRPFKTSDISPTLCQQDEEQSHATDLECLKRLDYFSSRNPPQVVRTDNTRSNFKVRKEDPSLMNAFQRRNFKLDDPIEQGTSCYEQEVNATKSLLFF